MRFEGAFFLRAHDDRVVLLSGLVNERDAEQETAIGANAVSDGPGGEDHVIGFETPAVAQPDARVDADAVEPAHVPSAAAIDRYRVNIAARARRLRDEVQERRLVRAVQAPVEPLGAHPGELAARVTTGFPTGGLLDGVLMAAHEVIQAIAQHTAGEHAALGVGVH